MKKKICFIVATPATANSFLLKHFEYLSQDFDIYLVANFEDNASVLFSSPYIKETKNILIQRNISIIEDFKSLFFLMKYLKQMQFDAVHSVTPKAGLIGILGAKIAGIPIRTHIFTGQVWYTKKGLFKIFLKNIDRFIVYCSTQILVDGQSQRQFLIKNKIIKENKSQVIGKGSISGVDTDKFIPNDSIKSKCRKELHIINNEVVFLFLGRLNLDKGVLDLAKAFSILNDKFINTKLVFVGTDEENIESQIKEICDNSKSVIFYGSTTIPQEVLQLADVFCLASYREGFGTSVIEASLLELPVICSDTYGLMETIVENETGLRHKVGDIDSLFEQMKKMMDEKLRVSLGINGRKYVLANFSASVISKHWVDFYKERLK